MLEPFVVRRALAFLGFPRDLRRQSKRPRQIRLQRRHARAPSVTRDSIE